MKPERIEVIFTMIGLSAHEFGDRHLLVTHACQYGTRYNLKREEVKEVLNMNVGEVARIIKGIKV